MNILVTGATGRVGTHVVQALIDKAHVTATSRSPRTGGSADQPHLAWVQADLADPQPWRTLLEGADAAFLFPAFGQTQPFIDAARDTHLPRLVLLSSGAAADDEDSFIKTAHLTIEQQATDAGINTIRIRPTVFMANDLAWVDAIHAGVPVPLPYPAAAMPVIAEQDIAAAVAACLLTQPDRDTFHVTGPQTLTQADRLDALTRHLTGHDATYRDSTEQARRHGLPGMPPPAADYLLRNLAAATKRPIAATNDVTELLGRPAMSYSTWLQHLPVHQ